MKLILMGTGPFALPAFEGIRARGQDAIKLVVTRPIPVNPSGRPPANPVCDWANQYALPVYQPGSINDPESVRQLVELSPDLLVVCDYGQILSGQALSAARLGGINLHGSLLPKYRGAAPVQWSVLSGDSVTGVTVIHMTPKLDAGPILEQRTLAIGAEETSGELEHRLSQLGCEPTLKSIEQLRECGSLEQTFRLGAAQDPDQTSKAPRLSKSDGQLDFRFPAQLIQRQVLGLQPWPGVFGTLRLSEQKSIRVNLHRTQVIQAAPADGVEHQAGDVVWGEPLRNAIPDWATPAELAVCCREPSGRANWLSIQSLQPAGKRSMSAAEFLRGYGKGLGLRFEAPETPSTFLPKLKKLLHVQ
jgi:methionyl-tRNA formyltransferase